MSTQTLRPARVHTPRPNLEVPMTWGDVCADPALQDLPFKIELDRYGRLLMSPVGTRHSILQGRIGRLIMEHAGGESFPEIATRTSEGVRVPDVGWMPDARVEALDLTDGVLNVAPEICVEVRSKSNVWAEMEEKIGLFLNAGAHEVWVYEADGRMRYFGPDGELDRSKLAPSFPAHVPLPGGLL